ncbi:MAG: hypothetical protein ACSHXF_05305 [Aquaticitalea sp.]
MASNSEIGNAINIANLGTLHGYTLQVGPLWNPTSSKLASPAINTLFVDASALQTDVNDSLPPYSLAVDFREALFGPVPKNLTRLRKSFKVTEGVTTGELDNLDTLIRKYKGEKKVKPKVVDPNKDPYSDAQLSYVQRTNTIGEIVAFLQSVAVFNPNEAEFKPSYYINLKATMLTATKNVGDTFGVNAVERGKRDTKLYKGDDSVVHVGNMGKAYFETILPPNDPILKAVRRLKFTKPSHIK